MTKAVFTTKLESSYDGRPDVRYHFPRTYLRQAELAVGDEIVYYEPRRPSVDVLSRGGRKVYFATARLQRIEHDPVRRDHYYAIISNYPTLTVPFPSGREVTRTNVVSARRTARPTRRPLV